MGPTARRWLDIVILGLVAAVAFEVALPVGVGLLSRLAFPTWWGPFAIRSVAWIAVAALMFLLTEPLRLRATQWRSVFRYPPLWIAIAMGVVIAALVEPLLLPRTGSVGQGWRDWELLLPLVGAAAAGASIRLIAASSRRPAGRVYPTAEPITISDWKALSEWVGAEAPACGDLFAHLPIAARIAGALRRDRDTGIAVLGGYGSGKTSIVNWARQEVQAHWKRRVLFVDTNCWAIPRAEDAPRVALQNVIDALGEIVDMVAFRGLPTNYQRLVAAEPTGVIRRVLDAAGEPDPLAELRRLGPILAALNLRLIVVLEDADRAGPEFDTRHLERLLWGLRDVPRISFVVAFDNTQSGIDYSKLCDVVELVPRVPPHHVRRLLAIAHSHWMTDGESYIDPVRDRARDDKLTVSNLDNEMLQYAHRLDQDTPVDAIRTLLETPRKIKHFIRRTESAWNSLRGEIDLDELVTVCALREGAPEVFEFLVDNIDPARHKPDDFSKGTQTVRAKWDALLDRIPNRHSVERLVDLLGIQQLRSGKGVGVRESPQGVQQETDSTDYFRRALAGQLASDEVRDQAVLSDIHSWQTSRQGGMMPHLLAADEESEPYLDAWEHFASQLSEADLYEVADMVIESTLTRDGVLSSIDNPGMLAVWRRCIRQWRYNSYADWLAARIRRVLPTSLHFANDLFSYFSSSKIGGLSDSGQAQVRAAFVAAVKDTCGTPDGLARCVSSERPYSLFRLVCGPHDERWEPLSEWAWLGPVILDAMKSAPDHLFAPIAWLLLDFTPRVLDPLDQGHAGVAAKYLLNLDRARTLFGAGVTDVLTMLASGRREGEVKDAVEQAQLALDQREPDSGQSAGAGSA